MNRVTYAKIFCNIRKSMCFIIVFHRTIVRHRHQLSHLHHSREVLLYLLALERRLPEHFSNITDCRKGGPSHRSSFPLITIIICHLPNACHTIAHKLRCFGLQSSCITIFAITLQVQVIPAGRTVVQTSIISAALWMF